MTETSAHTFIRQFQQHMQSVTVPDDFPPDLPPGVEINVKVFADKVMHWGRLKHKWGDLFYRRYYPGSKATALISQNFAIKPASLYKAVDQFLTYPCLMVVQGHQYLEYLDTDGFDVPLARFSFESDDVSKNADYIFAAFPSKQEAILCKLAGAEFSLVDLEIPPFKVAA